MATVDFSLPRAKHLSVVDSRALLPESERPPVDPKTGAPDKLRAFVVSQDPKISIVANFMTDVECEHLLNLVEGNWMPSLVGGPEKGSEKPALKNKPSQNRTSWSCQLRYSQTAIVERLEHRLASIAGLPVGQFERMNMVRYAPGEQFNEHHDGKFRPITVFVYLNDLDDDDDQGDTFFPVLGFSFRPRKGTAVVWPNARPDGKEDSRMLHAGKAPRKCVKYGVNCFFNDKDMRSFMPMDKNVPLGSDTPVYMADLAADAMSKKQEAKHAEQAEEDEPLLTAFCVCKDPKLCAVPGFMDENEVKHLLSLAGLQSISDVPPREVGGPFDAGTRTVRVVEYDETETVTAIERRLTAVTGHTLEHLAKMRLVCTGTVFGLCNRGSGHKSVYVCLSAHDEVFFPRLGLRFIMRAGDALVWPNLNFETGTSTEDLRTVRVHLGDHQGGAAVSVLGLDAFIHDNPLRQEQKLRAFVPDSIFKQ